MSACPSAWSSALRKCTTSVSPTSAWSVGPGIGGGPERRGEAGGHLLVDDGGEAARPGDPRAQPVVAAGRGDVPAHRARLDPVLAGHAAGLGLRRAERERSPGSRRRGRRLLTAVARPRRRARRRRAASRSGEVLPADRAEQRLPAPTARNRGAMSWCQKSPGMTAAPLTGCDRRSVADVPTSAVPSGRPRGAARISAIRPPARRLEDAPRRRRCPGGRRPGRGAGLAPRRGGAGEGVAGGLPRGRRLPAAVLGAGVGQRRVGRAIFALSGRSLASGGGARSPVAAEEEQHEHATTASRTMSKADIGLIEAGRAALRAATLRLTGARRPCA